MACFVSIEADEFVVLRHFNFLFMFVLEVLEAALHVVFMNIRNGHQLHALAGTERLARRARARRPCQRARFSSVAGRSRVRETFDGQRAERRRARDGFEVLEIKLRRVRAWETEIILFMLFGFFQNARLARGYSTVENGSAQSVAISSPPVQPGIGVGQRKNFSHG